MVGGSGGGGVFAPINRLKIGFNCKICTNFMLSDWRGYVVQNVKIGIASDESK